ncbi:MAG: phenylalanine 4-monooxygenase [Silvanigrellales bacterium]|nr:phenylalanine 4-monooxygenase [Silvanigrellales bacterium]
MGFSTLVPKIPEGPLSADVEFKARPSLPVRESPSPEGTIGSAIVPPQYAEEQHSTWSKMFLRQEAILQGRVCDEYIEARAHLQLPSHRVPHLADVNASLEPQSGWRVIRVGGYVPEPIFFKILANRCFPCTDFVRHPDELEYTPAPDMFHDIMGHLPLFLNPRFASFFYQWGQAGLRASTPEEIAMLGRIYWFTVEFGLINPTAHAGAKRDPAACRIYGAGIASSVGEILHSLSPAVEKRPFNIDEIAARVFDIHHMQDTLYEISTFAELEDEFVRWASGKRLLEAA